MSKDGADFNIGGSVSGASLISASALEQLQYLVPPALKPRGKFCILTLAREQV